MEGKEIMTKKINENLMQEKGQLLSTDLFSKECQMIPEYSIKINRKGVSLSHICNGKIINNPFQINGQKIQFEKKYNCCEKLTNTICMKCNELYVKIV